MSNKQNEILNKTFFALLRILTSENCRSTPVYRFLVFKETVVLRRWERSKQKFGFIKRVDKDWITTVKGLCLFAHNVYSDGDRNIAKRIWSYIFTRRFQWHCVFVNSLLLQLFTCLACLRSLLLWHRCYIVNQSFCSGGYLLCIVPIDHIRILSIGLELACNGG